MNNVLECLLEQLRPYFTSIVMDALTKVQLEMNAESNFPEKINITQASEITGYSKNSLYQMHSKGTIPGALKLGGKLLFDTATLKSWVNSGGLR